MRRLLPCSVATGAQWDPFCFNLADMSPMMTQTRKVRHQLGKLGSSGGDYHTDLRRNGAPASWVSAVGSPLFPVSPRAIWHTNGTALALGSSSPLKCLGRAGPGDV